MKKIEINDLNREVKKTEAADVKGGESGSGMATGRRTYEPLTIRKRIDKATP